MTTYNLDAIKARLQQMTQTNSGSSNEDTPKFTYFKPELGPNGAPNSYNIRFLPYRDQNGQPFQEVVYYESKQLSDKRFVAPSQFGLEDPIAELERELSKDRSDEVWQTRKELRGRTKFYAPILVRGQEDKGWQLWEFSQTTAQEVYAYLAHEDYESEDLMDPYTGYDWSLDVTDSGKKFNGYTVKSLNLKPRRKSSPIFGTGKGDKAAIEALVAEVPNLAEVYRKFCPSTEKCKAIIENFLNGGSTDEDEKMEAGGAMHVGANKDSSKATKKQLDDAFSELDNMTGSLF